MYKKIQQGWVLCLAPDHSTGVDFQWPSHYSHYSMKNRPYASFTSSSMNTGQKSVIQNLTRTQLKVKSSNVIKGFASAWFPYIEHWQPLEANKSVQWMELHHYNRNANGMSHIDPYLFGSGAYLWQRHFGIMMPIKVSMSWRPKIFHLSLTPPIDFQKLLTLYIIVLYIKFTPIYTKRCP